ncbi:MAG: hypothetical protein N2450_05395 [bacterium]|nr:hypothetical protein [bacterium]
MNKNPNKQMRLNPLRIIFDQEELPKSDLFQIQAQIEVSENEHCVQSVNGSYKSVLDQLPLSSQFVNFKKQ